MATIASLANRGEELGFPRESLAKLALVKDEAIERLAHFREAGVKLGFGTDLLGKLEADQCTEFSLRANIFSNYEILCQATGMNGEILGKKGMLGVIKPGAFADILLVDGNPLEDINVLACDGANFRLIMKGGVTYKREL
jgi:imidazolonepropionase-like amidohydrolase